MTRDILFRGKVSDEPDEWVIGSLIIRNDNDYAIFQQNEHELTKCCGFGTFGVNAETIGQYTGTKDKNGKMIFEGDIVRQPVYCGKIGACDIVFIDGKFQARWKNDYTFKEYLYYDLNSKTEILGNIHDSPELLLKGEKNDN